jgi:hypothetical protein
VLSGLALHCKASIRATQKMLEDFLDYSMSLGSGKNINMGNILSH